MKKILIVDDDPLVVTLIQESLNQVKLAIDTALTAEIALTKMCTLHYDVILIDIQLPGISGLDLCQKIKKSLNSTARIICMSGYPSQEIIIKCYSSGAVNFLHKPFEIRELIAIVKMAAYDIRYINDIESQIRALLMALESRDYYTSGHSKNVAHISRNIGKEAGLSEKELHCLHIACLIHDLGKIGIRDEILNKKGKLTETEYAEIKKHPLQFQSIIASIPISCDAISAAADHHEKFDGSGYPFGRMYNNIHAGGRIMAIADVYDALTSTRSYKHAWSHSDAVHEISKQKGKHFDPDFTEIFLDICRKNPPKLFIDQ